MKKFLLIIFLSLLFNNNIHAKYIEIICSIEEEWDSSLNKNKIWIKYNKPKHYIHFDETNLKITKIAYSKNKEDMRSVDFTVEKILEENFPSFNFITSANISNSEDVINEIRLTDFGGTTFRFGIYIEQYRLKPQHTALITKEISNPIYSEFKKARIKVNSETFSTIGRIKYFGGQSGLCESEIKN